MPATTDRQRISHGDHGPDNHGRQRNHGPYGPDGDNHGRQRISQRVGQYSVGPVCIGIPCIEVRLPLSGFTSIVPV